MIGNGAPQGTYTSHGVGHDYGVLKVDHRYRVARDFTDFDRQLHPVGEEWIYIGTAFLPYDDGRSLFVSLDGVREWRIRMQDRPEEKRDVPDNLAIYLRKVDPA
jgi:hypothetical protein